jgi:hypothetical protein
MRVAWNSLTRSRSGQPQSPPFPTFGTAEIVRQVATRREMTVQLLKDNQQLRRELASNVERVRASEPAPIA